MWFKLLLPGYGIVLDGGFVPTCKCPDKTIQGWRMQEECSVVPVLPLPYNIFPVNTKKKE